MLAQLGSRDGRGAWLVGVRGLQAGAGGVVGRVVAQVEHVSVVVVGEVDDDAVAPVSELGALLEVEGVEIVALRVPDLSPCEGDLGGVRGIEVERDVVDLPRLEVVASRVEVVEHEVLLGAGAVGDGIAELGEGHHGRLDLVAVCLEVGGLALDPPEAGEALGAVRRIDAVVRLLKALAQGVETVALELLPEGEAQAVGERVVEERDELGGVPGGHAEAGGVGVVDGERDDLGGLCAGPDGEVGEPAPRVARAWEGRDRAARVPGVGEGHGEGVVEAVAGERVRHRDRRGALEGDSVPAGDARSRPW